jgi:pimeloyl-ACP methyl ester carboxylesterase
MEEKEFALNHKKIFYRTIGNGPAVVLLHGFGEAGWVWKNQFNAIKDFQFIVPDLPGSGRSEMIEDMSMEGLAEAIRQLLNHLEIDQCSMIGHSMGGYITLAFAEKYPSLLNSYGLFHSTAFADTEEKKANRKKTIESIQENGASAFLQNFIPGLYGSYFKQQQPNAIDNHLTQVADLTEAALIAYSRSMIERPDRTNVLKQNKMPVLFVLGKEDAAIPFQNTLKLASMPDILYIHVFEMVGHMGMIEEPEQSNHILNNFLLKTI